MQPIQELSLRHPGGETAVLTGFGALRVAEERLTDWVAGRTLFVVTTPRVAALYAPRLEPLRRAAGEVVLLEVEEGEAAKSLARAGDLWQRMLAAGGRRDSRLAAFGGGSVGDLGGFVAGCFLRGIGFAQLPTTLLAQVDAALGGKTAVDLPAAKNSVGLFHHPAMVVADTDLLATLPPAELRAGLAEVVKMAALLDPGLLTQVERRLPRLLAGDPEALAPVVAAAAAAKIGVVERDPTERGERRLLNFGHTLGHALEAALGYGGLRHGEAVAYGMLFALRLAVPRGLDAAVADQLRSLLRRFELPALPPVAPARVLAAMSHDKKAGRSGLVWVLPAALGRGVMVEGIERREVEEQLHSFLANPWG